MDQKIKVEEIMSELRARAAARKYPKEAPEFDSVQQNAEAMPPFRFHFFQRELTLFNRNCYVEYDIPITGKGVFLKKMVRKLYRFHLKPLFDKQNDINLELRVLMGQIEEYIAQTERREQELQIRIEKLEQELETMRQNQNGR